MNCGAGGQKKRGLEETGRRANWICDRDGNEWNCTREKTKREAKKAMERCLLIDAKIVVFYRPQDYYPLFNDFSEIISNLWNTL